MNLFQDEMEQEAIGRIQRFARLAETIYFVTIYFTCTKEERCIMQDFYGIGRGMTVNGEW